MNTVYLACLFGGLVATVLFAALGALGGLAGHSAGHLHAGPGQAGHLSSGGPTDGHALPAHAATGHHAGAAGHAAAHAHGSAPEQAAALPGWLSATFGWTLSWLSPLTLAAAALWFGGAGLLAESVLPAGLAAVALLVAIAAAVLGAALVRGVMAAFLRASTPPLRADAVGALGTLSAAIRADAPGEVIYTLEGLRRSAAARSVDGAPLPRGADVVIVRRERGIAWVEAIDPLLALGQDEPPAIKPYNT